MGTAERSAALRLLHDDKSPLPRWSIRIQKERCLAGERELSCPASREHGFSQTTFATAHHHRNTGGRCPPYANAEVPLRSDLRDQLT